MKRPAGTSSAGKSDRTAGHSPLPSAKHHKTPARPQTAERKRWHPTTGWKGRALQVHLSSSFPALMLRQPCACSLQATLTEKRAACPKHNCCGHKEH